MNDVAPPPGQLILELPSPEHTDYFAQHLAQYLSLPMVITLSGDIGAGKTTVVRALLRALGVQGPIKSPTYSLLETYDLPSNSLLFSMPAQCHHFDLYRVMDDSELDLIGFRDYFQSNAICCIEWPEHSSLPSDLIDVALLITRSGNGRTLHLKANARTEPLLRLCVQQFNDKNQN